MIRKENVKLFIKQKNIITAFIFFMFFLVVLLITFIQPLTLLHGVRDGLSADKIEFVRSNNYDTTYIVSDDNELYYSQNKYFDDSHLNKYCNIKTIANEYGDATAKIYNFIKVEYQFEGKIIDVKGYADDISGNKGYTLVLTDDGKLYYLANDVKDFTVILENIKSMNNMYRNLLVEDNNNDLYYYSIENVYHIKKIDLNISNATNYFLSNANDDLIELYYTSNNELYKETINYNLVDESSEEGIEDITDKVSINKESKEIKNIKQIANIDSSCLLLTTDNKLYGIDQQMHYFSNLEITLISNDKNINEIYSTGQFAFIIKADDGNFYIGDIRIDKTNDFVTINEIAYDCDNFYASRNGVFYIKKNILYLYDKNESTFKGMYINYFVSYILRYLSLFICAMIILYFVLSFYEDNKRFNRYFKKRYQKQDEK